MNLFLKEIFIQTLTLNTSNMQINIHIMKYIIYIMKYIPLPYVYIKLCSGCINILQRMVWKWIFFLHLSLIQGLNSICLTRHAFLDICCPSPRVNVHFYSKDEMLKTSDTIKRRFLFHENFTDKFLGYLITIMYFA